MTLPARQLQAALLLFCDRAMKGSRHVKHLRFAALALLATLVAPTAAQANWRFTQWGESVDDVVKAGKSAAKVHKQADQPETRMSGLSLLAVGEAAEFGLPVEIQFYFTADGKSLQMVRYVPKDVWLNATTEEYLLHYYGKTKVLEETRGDTAWRQLDWLQSDGDLIRLLEASSAAGEGYIWTIRPAG